MLLFVLAVLDYRHTWQEVTLPVTITPAAALALTGVMEELAPGGTDLLRDGKITIPWLPFKVTLRFRVGFRLETP